MPLRARAAAPPRRREASATAAGTVGDCHAVAIVVRGVDPGALRRRATRAQLRRTWPRTQIRARTTTRGCPHVAAARPRTPRRRATAAARNGATATPRPSLSASIPACPLSATRRTAVPGRGRSSPSAVRPAGDEVSGVAARRRATAAAGTALTASPLRRLAADRGLARTAGSCFPA